jgi:transposase-like protein
VARRPRRSFTDEFKSQAVELARTSGKSIKASRELDLTASALRGWWRARTPVHRRVQPHLLRPYSPMNCATIGARRAAPTQARSGSSAQM